MSWVYTAQRATVYRNMAAGLWSHFVPAPPARAHAGPQSLSPGDLECDLSEAPFTEWREPFFPGRRSGESGDRAARTGASLPVLEAALLSGQSAEEL